MSEWNNKKSMFDILEHEEKKRLLLAVDEYVDFLRQRYANIAFDYTISKREKYDRMFSIVRKLNELEKQRIDLTK